MGSDTDSESKPQPISSDKINANSDPLILFFYMQILKLEIDL